MLLDRRNYTRSSWPFSLNCGSSQANGLRYWFAGAPPGASAFDLSGYGNRGALSDQTWLSGQSEGSALSFTGSDKVTLSAITATSAWSAFAWIYPTTLAAGSFYGVAMSFANATPTTGDWWLVTRVAGATTGFGFGANGATMTRSNAADVITINNWWHIGGTYDGTTTRLYLNGVEYTTTTTEAMGGGWNVQACLGELYPSAAYRFIGKVEDVRCYSRVLTAAEVWDLYAPTTRYDLLYQPGFKRYVRAAVVAAPSIGRAVKAGDVAVPGYLLNP